MGRMLLTLGLLLAAGTAMAQTKADIDAANRKFVAAFTAGDAAGVAALYTENATLMPPGSPVMAGRKAIEAFWAGGIKAGLKNISLEALTVESHGKTGREIGRFAFDAPTPGGAPGQSGAMAHVEGKYVVIWKKVGKAWKLDVDIWNMDK